MKRILITWLIGVVSLVATATRAESFGTGANSFEIEFVTIGNPGNAPDDAPNPAGAVPYIYRMGKYEISEQMIDKANALGSLGITKDARGPDKPATSISWFEAARFVNWLNTSTGSVPAYKFDATGSFQLWLPTDAGYDANNHYRNKLATYFLPSVHEWHKAAYYDPLAGHYWEYPTASNVLPDGIDFVGDTSFDVVFNEGGFNLGPNDVTNVGMLSPYNTAGQGGNVTEWEETSFDRLNTLTLASRGVRGGGWGNISTHLLAGNRNAVGPAFEADFFGVRVASIVPEPNSIGLLGLGMLGVLYITARRSIERRPMLSTKPA